MRADRLVATLLLLQTRGRVTAREVATELEVSEKTARRDLLALGMAGLPVYSSSGRNGGWQLLGGATTDLSGLTAGEARTLFLTAGAAATLDTTSDTTRSLLRKLLRALPETFRADAEMAAQAVVVDPTGWGSAGPRPTPEHLPALRRAVIERRRVRLGYVDRTQAPSDRLVDPLGLVSKGSVWYLVAQTAEGERTFRVSRVRSVELTEERIERPEGFDLRAAWQSVVATVGERRLSVRATLRIDRGLVHTLRGQFGGDMMLAELDDTGTPDEVSDGDPALVVIGGPSALRIAEHLAGWGSLIEVVEPTEVRMHLARIGQELAAQYADLAPTPADRRNRR